MVIIMHTYKANVDSLPCIVFEILTFTFSHLYHKTEVSSKGRLFTRLQRVLEVITVLTNTRLQSNTPNVEQLARLFYGQTDASLRQDTVYSGRVNPGMVEWFRRF